MPSPTARPVADKTTLDTSQESATQALYRAAIGPLNIEYYLPLFSGFESTAKVALKWNTAASLYTLNWMMFRRLWGAAFVYACSVGGGALVGFGLGRLVFQLSTEIELGLAILMLLLSFVVPGWLGNTWLHADSRRRMAQALNQSSTLKQACDRLRAQSSSRNRFLGVVAINFALISVGLGLYWRADGAVEMKDTPPLPVTQSPPWPKPSPLNDLKSPEPLEAVIQTPVESPPPAEPVLAPALPMAQAVVEPTPRAPSSSRSTNAVATVKAVSTRYYVNVGLFSNAGNAERAHQRLKEEGLPVTTETVSLSKGKRSRVRVGPFPNRSEAEAAAHSIRALDLDAVVRPQ